MRPDTWPHPKRFAETSKCSCRGRRPHMAHRVVRCIARLCLRLKVSAQPVDATQALNLSDGCNEYGEELLPAAGGGHGQVLKALQGARSVFLVVDDMTNGNPRKAANLIVDSPDSASVTGPDRCRLARLVTEQLQGSVPRQTPRTPCPASESGGRSKTGQSSICCGTCW